MIKLFKVLNKAANLADSCEVAAFAILLGGQVLFKSFSVFFFFFFLASCVPISVIDCCISSS